MIEKVLISHGEHVRYRIRSNPDGDALDGSQGIVIDWQDNDGDNKWYGHMFIAPEQIEEVALCLLKFREKLK